MLFFLLEATWSKIVEGKSKSISIFSRILFQIVNLLFSQPCHFNY